MLTRTSTPPNPLDGMIAAGVLECGYHEADSGIWRPITDRKMLFHAAIACLLEQAESEGFIVTREDEWIGEPITAIHVDNAPEDDYDRDYCESCEGEGANEDGSTCADCQGFGSIIIEPCDKLGSGCTCESCTKQITDAIGL